MTKTTITSDLEHAIRRATAKMGTFGCPEVTIGFFGSERVDYMTVDTKGVWRCYEIKCSVADFNSKAKKTFVGHYNYYVLTEELFEKVKDKIPKEIGVYIGKGHYARSVKRATRQELKEHEETLKMSMIRSLSRDAAKFHIAGDMRAIDSHKREIKRLTDENRALKQQNRSHIMELNVLRREGSR